MRDLHLRLFPLLCLAACGGGGGPSDDPGGGGPVVVLQKAAVSGDAQSGVVADTLGSPLAVLVTEDGVAAPGRVVAFTPAAGSGVAAPAVDTTDANGVAQTFWILGTGAGARTLTASTPGATGSPLLFHATALPGPAASFGVTSGGGQTEEASTQFAQPLVARVADGFGNSVPGVIVAWEVLSGSATLGQATDTTGADGRSSVTVTAGADAGAVSVRATAQPLSGAPVQFSLTVVPASTHVTIHNNFFSPTPVNIAVGGAVKWIWEGTQHNVTSDSGPAPFPNSPTQAAGATYGPIVFNTAGTYYYECTVHIGMTGSIVVTPVTAPRPGGKR